ncbi:MAG: hypothetical protein HY507_01375 [Candidatus Zambryskibacteria bacterium]|nr:hypothetical protein [Candidatus Zambryskibacteria bacterium]
MEQETFWTLLGDLPHWEFELFLIFIFDVLLGLLIWPQIKKFTKHHKSDDERIRDLEKEVKELKSKK